MALLSREEIVDRLGISHAYFNVYLKRKKINLNKDGLVDTNDPLNADFIKARMSKAPDIPVGESLKEQKQKAKEARNSVPIIEDSGVSKYDLEVSIKQADLEKKQNEIELLKIKRQKLEGELIPTELVTHVFVRQAKTITTEFHNALNSYISTLKSRYKLSNEDVALMRGEVTRLTNKAIEDSTTAGLKDIESIVDDYSETRERGERT